MNFFHKSRLENRVLAFVENFFKRFCVDLFKAEIIMSIVLGTGFFSLSNQAHVVVNRLVSGSYLFNAILLDRLVACGSISRGFRSGFILFASTFGNMLALLDLAHTSIPVWLPAVITNHLTWVSNPLSVLIAFNSLVFTILALGYTYHLVSTRPAGLTSAIDHAYAYVASRIRYSCSTIMETIMNKTITPWPNRR